MKVTRMFGLQHASTVSVAGQHLISHSMWKRSVDLPVLHSLLCYRLVVVIYSVLFCTKNKFLQYNYTLPQIINLSLSFGNLLGLQRRRRWKDNNAQRVWRHSVVVSGIGLINEVNRHWARLVLRWVAACGRVNHLGM